MLFMCTYIYAYNFSYNLLNLFNTVFMSMSLGLTNIELVIRTSFLEKTILHLSAVIGYL